MIPDFISIMKNILLLFLLFPVASPLFAQKDKAAIEATIVKFFDGLTDVDTAKLNATTTADFLLLEVGEVWNMDTLVHKIAPSKNSGRKRVNSFQFIKTDQKNDVAWVSYFNTAEISMGERKQDIRWLESAVLIRQGKSWKIQLLHSTRMR